VHTLFRRSGFGVTLAVQRATEDVAAGLGATEGFLVAERGGLLRHGELVALVVSCLGVGCLGRGSEVAAYQHVTASLHAAAHLGAGVASHAAFACNQGAG